MLQLGIHEARLFFKAFFDAKAGGGVVIEPGYKSTDESSSIYDKRCQFRHNVSRFQLLSTKERCFKMKNNAQ